MEEKSIDKIKVLMEDFYNLTGIKTCVYDSEGNEVCFYPERLTKFCFTLRKDEKMEERCLDCDRRAFEICRKTKKQYVYRCHSGLIECISPICYGNQIIGFIAIGQIKSKEAKIPTFVDKMQGTVREELIMAFESVPTIEMDKIKSAVDIIDACAGYEYLKGMFRENEKRINVKISNFITENLVNNLSVQSICSKFQLSRVEVYSIFKEYFNATVADYVKEKRLEEAVRLLNETDLQINEIAIRCGIPDYNYFSKTFKKRYKISPREYRKKMAK